MAGTILLILATSTTLPHVRHYKLQWKSRKAGTYTWHPSENSKCIPLLCIVVVVVVVLPLLCWLNIYVYFLSLPPSLLQQNDPPIKQELPGQQPGSRDPVWPLRTGYLRWCHHLADSNTCGRLRAIHHRVRVHEVSFYAVSVPRWDYDHHHRRDNSGLCARFHHHPDDTVQGRSVCLA